MIYSQEDKKLVDQYKQTNIALRKQLNNLNNEIDRILIKRSSKIGLQKLPTVSKQITDPHIMQHQIQNMRKRLQLLQKDAETYKSKAAVNYYAQIKELQSQLQDRETLADQYRKLIKQYERKDKIANVQTGKQTSKIDKRISYLQQQIGRYQKMEKDLIKQINNQQANEHKTINYIQQLTARHGEVTIKKQQQRKTLSPPKTIEIKPQASIDEEEWKKLKKQFLIFKQSKQNQQFSLNEENQRLRAQINGWQKKIKEKRRKIDTIQQIQEKSRHSRIYSTLNTDNKESRPYRYRDKSNSIQYNTKQ